MARLLVVEDEPTDRVILVKLLERMGHEVYVASDGEEAFKTYLKNSIEIIITDLEMPRVDGLEFIETVLALFPRAVIIAVSGKGQILLDEAKRMGAFMAFSKPIDPQELRDAVAGVYGTSGRNSFVVVSHAESAHQPITESHVQSDRHMP